MEIPNESLDSDRENEAVDPFMYCSPRYFAFSRGTYDLMVNDLSGQVKGTLEALHDVTRVHLSISMHGGARRADSC